MTDAPESAVAAPAVSRHRLAKAVGVGAVLAAALTNEFGSGINLVAPNSVGAYPGVEYLAPVAMLVTGILLLPKLSLFARFSAHLPSAGSSYAWIGRTLSPGAAFVVTFLWWVGLAAAQGVVGYTFATFLSNAFVTAGWPGAGWLAGETGEVIIGLAAIWFFVLVNVLGVNWFAGWARATAVIVAVTAAVVIGYGFATSPATFLGHASASAHVTLAAPAHSSGPTASAFLAVAAVFVFAYGGLESGASLGGETRTARRDVPRGLLLAWASAFVLYTLITFAVFHAAPWWAVRDLVNRGDSSLATVPGLIGLVAPRALAVIIDLLTAVIVAKTINPEIMALSRMLFGWGTDHLLPAWFARTSARKVPVPAIVVSALVGSAFLVQTVLEGFSLGVVIRSLTLLLVDAAVAVGLLNIRFIQRRRFSGSDWAGPLSRGWGIVVAAVGAIIVGAIFVASTITKSGSAFYLQPWFEAVITAAIGVALWLAAARRARRNGVDLRAIAATPPAE